MAKSVSWSQPQQAATEGGCSKGLAEHLKIGSTTFGLWFLDFKKYLTAEVFYPSIKKNPFI